MDHVWRTLTKDDAAALAGLTAAAEAVDRVDDHYNADDFIEEFEGPSVDERDGSRGAFVDGRLVAAGIVYKRTTADPVHRMFFWGQVRPEFRRQGFGTRVVEWALDVAPRITDRYFPGAGTEVVTPVHESLAGNAALLTRHGFEAERYEFSMELPLGDREPGTTRVPEGFTLINFEDSLSEEFRETHNIAFVPDHPGSTEQTLESWPHVMGIGSPTFRPDLCFGLRDSETGMLAGYLFSRVDEATLQATGRRKLYLAYIGTRREYRKRGVASTLINAAADGAAAQGFDAASLIVYADNPSGALGVYQSAGFEVRHKMTVVKRRLTA